MIIEKTCENSYAPDDMVFNYLNAEQHELTVTITLHEYRELLKAKITSEFQKEKLDWIKQYQRANEAEAKCKDLEAKVAALKDLIAKENTDKDVEVPRP